MTQLRKPLLGLMAALVALFAVLAITGSEASQEASAADRVAPGPSA